jgi:hypothetical protein
MPRSGYCSNQRIRCMPLTLGLSSREQVIFTGARKIATSVMPIVKGLVKLSHL